MILNYTPHEVNIINLGAIPSSGLARATSSREEVFKIEGISVNRTSFGEVTGLPEETEGTWIIVSRIVAEACKGLRNDLLIVDETVRDDAGQIVGAKAFAII